MGYYASWGGTLVLRPNTPDNVIKTLYNSFGVKVDENNYEVDFDGYDKYYEDEWVGKNGLLSLVNNYTEECYIEFHGEDNETWCFQYDKDKKGFIFGVGETVYKFDKEVMRFE